MKSGHKQLECKDPDCGGMCNACCLAICTVCGGAEGSLPTECPGVEIVDHGDASHPARFEAHFDRLRTGIDGVFQQLLDDRGRPVHHLAGSDLVGNLVGKYADAAHSSLG